MNIPEELLEILACPRCKQELVPVHDRDRLDCEQCRLSFPVRDDIPVMLIDEAEPF